MDKELVARRREEKEDGTAQVVPPLLFARALRYKFIPPAFCF